MMVAPWVSGMVAHWADQKVHDSVGQKVCLTVALVFLWVYSMEHAKAVQWVAPTAVQWVWKWGSKLAGQRDDLSAVH